MEAKERLTINLLAEQRPVVFEDLCNGKGTVNYNHNISEVFVKKTEGGGVEVVSDEAESTGKMFKYDCLRVDWPLTRNNILATLLNAKFDRNEEQKLMNDYEAAQLGILDESYKAPYVAFLKERKSLKEMVDADGDANNIPNTL